MAFHERKITKSLARQKTKHNPKNSRDSRFRDIPIKSRWKCYFCNDAYAAVTVDTKFSSKAFCLLHYYTTRACRADPSKVKIIGEGTGEDNEKCISVGYENKSSELRFQLPSSQDLFHEAFTRLQKDISTESERHFQTKSSDPLSILHQDAQLSKPNRKIKMPSAILTHKSATILQVEKITKRNEDNEGGFILTQSRCERAIIDKQQRQCQDIEKLMAMSKVDGNPYKKRKSTKVNFQNLALSNDESVRKKIKQMVKSSTKGGQWVQIAACICGSSKVELDGSITGVNNDVAKAETWGTKRENDITIRYKCLSCGKIWNEEQ
mmetsp:Transcript_15909/g.22659  ORF Transcript_15909/g.22659 Transcript_15909/m.22659 type:complete len:322 (-) Transcript_15909:187-1152(-)